MRNALALLLVGFLTACGGSAPREGTVPEASEGDPYPELARVRSLVQGGRCDQALREVLEPVVARMERDFPEPRHADRALESAASFLNGMLRESGAMIVSSATPTLYPDTLYLTAYCQVELGRLDDAERTLERALAVMEDVAYLCELGNIYQMRRQFADAMPFYERGLASAQHLAEHASGVSLFGQDVPFWTRRAMRGIGFSLIELVRLEEAEAIYERVLELDATDEQAQRELRVIAEIREGRFDVGTPAPVTPL
jgi:tetratricopeptide (TPR) repeat protein